MGNLRDRKFAFTILSDGALVIGRVLNHGGAIREAGSKRQHSPARLNDTHIYSPIQRNTEATKSTKCAKHLFEWHTNHRLA